MFQICLVPSLGYRVEIAKVLIQDVKSGDYVLSLNE